MYFSITGIWDNYFYFWWFLRDSIFIIKFVILGCDCFITEQEISSTTRKCALLQMITSLSSCLPSAFQCTGLKSPNSYHKGLVRPYDSFLDFCLLWAWSCHGLSNYSQEALTHTDLTCKSQWPLPLIWQFSLFFVLFSIYNWIKGIE